MQPLNDDELKQTLAQWEAPRAPASLESRLHTGDGLRWWQWLLRGDVRVPAPVGALALVLLVVLGSLAFRGGPEPASELATDPSNFQLVDDLNPRIIRSAYENN